MKIEQFEDKNLAHYSYAILSEGSKEVVLIDPARDPQPYVDYADAHGAKIIGVIETHPHADFVSSHLEIQQQTGAKIFVSKLMNAAFSFEAFDDGDVIEFGKLKLSAINTPGHSPESISVLLSREGKDIAIFTGDTLFIGDCGRPDLREQGENLEVKREVLAKQMFSSLREKLMTLADDVIVYPAHGAGTLCGKALSKAKSSTMAAEKMSNWSLQDMSRADFVKALTADQPFVPSYFPYNVDLNKKGAPNLKESVAAVAVEQIINPSEDLLELDHELFIIDTRDAEAFKSQHLNNAINLMGGDKFETWLGTLILPGNQFYLSAATMEKLKTLIARIAKIGYEPFIKKAFVMNSGSKTSEKLDLNKFKSDLAAYTIVDIRNESEVAAQPIFEDAIHIPLPELNIRFHEIPTDKPIVVHCAGGYRSAAGSSILENKLEAKVFDLSEQIKDFIKAQ